MNQINTLLGYKFIPGFRRNSNLLFIPSENQIYKFKNRNGSYRYYICYHENCGVAVALDSNSTTENKCRKTRTLKHNHGSQKKIINKLNLINKIKINCEKFSKDSNIREIFENCCKKYKRNGTHIEFGRIRRNLYLIKNKVPLLEAPISFSNIIKCFENESILKQYGMSKCEKGKKFYIDTIIETEFAYSIFMSPTIHSVIKNLGCNSLNFLVDDTFSVKFCENMSKPLAVIHIVHAENVFPFIYLLMSSKTEKIFTHALQFIKDNIFDLKPDTIQTDVENFVAIKRVYPQVTLKQCWFHYTQALKRYALKLPKLNNSSKQLKSAERHLNKFLILPFLKPTDFMTAYELLKEEALSSTYVTANKSIFEPFIEYFEQQWLHKHGADNLTIHVRNMKTTSSAELFNCQLIAKLSKSCDFFKFLNIILDEDCAKSSDIMKSIVGSENLCEHQEEKQKVLDEFIEDVMKNYNMNEIEFNDVLDQLTSCENSIFGEEVLSVITETNNNSEKENIVDRKDSKKLRTINSEETRNNTDDEKNISNKNKKIKRHQDILKKPCEHYKLCSKCFENFKMACAECKEIETPNTKKRRKSY